MKMEEIILGVVREGDVVDI